MGHRKLENYQVFLFVVLQRLSEHPGGLLVRGRINRVRVLVGQQLLDGIVQLVDDSILDFSLWRGGVDCCIKASNPLNCVQARNVIYTVVIQIVGHSWKELGVFIFTNPHTHDIFRPSRLAPKVCTLLFSVLPRTY